MTKDSTRGTITASNISLGWASVLDRLAERGVESISPLSLSITGFDQSDGVTESPIIRKAVDDLLQAKGKRGRRKCRLDHISATLLDDGQWRPRGVFSDVSGSVSACPRLQSAK